ncbi:MAG: PfkB family carbohydrate kinase [Clostridia bacterium]
MNIKEIAKLANVSVSTVSKIMNEKDASISAETRERVLRIVKECNYAPYAGVRPQKQAHSLLLGVMVHGAEERKELLLSIVDTARAEGYSTIVCISATPEEEYKNLAMLQAHHVDGIIWDQLTHADERCRALLAKNPLPLRRMDDSRRPSGQNLFLDYWQMGYLCAKTLLDQKHKNLLCLVEKEDAQSGFFRAGFEQCAYDAHLPGNHCGCAVVGGAEQAELIPFEVTGVVCMSVALAARVYAEAHRTNRRIPKYLSVISLQDAPETLLPKLATVELPYKALGAFACHGLIEAIEGRAVQEEPFAGEYLVHPNKSLEAPYSLREQKIVVVGTLNMDTLITLGKLPSTGETLLASHRTTLPGGKGVNQAIGAAKLGAEVYLIGKLGKDYDGSQLFSCLQQCNVNTEGVFSTFKADTGHAYVYVQENGESGIVVYGGANNCLSVAEIESREGLFEGASYCMLQTELSMEIVACAARLAARHGAKVILKPSALRALESELLEHVSILVPNEREMALLCPQYETLEQRAQYFLDRGVQTVIVTLGHRGCYLRDAAHSEYFPAADFTPVDTTGAADAFIAALAVYLSLHYELCAAIRYATCAAGYSITRRGVPPALIDREMLEFYMGDQSARKRE